MSKSSSQCKSANFIVSNRILLNYISRRAILLFGTVLYLAFLQSFWMEYLTCKSQYCHCISYPKLPSFKHIFILYLQLFSPSPFLHLWIFRTQMKTQIYLWAAEFWNGKSNCTVTNVVHTGGNGSKNENQDLRSISPLHLHLQLP